MALKSLGMGTVDSVRASLSASEAFAATTATTSSSHVAGAASVVVVLPVVGLLIGLLISTGSGPPS